MPSARTAKRHVLRETAIEQHRITMAVLRHETDRQPDARSPRFGGESTGERTKQLALAASLDGSNARRSLPASISNVASRTRTTTGSSESVTLSARNTGPEAEEETVRLRERSRRRARPTPPPIIAAVSVSGVHVVRV